MQRIENLELDNSRPNDYKERTSKIVQIFDKYLGDERQAYIRQLLEKIEELCTEKERTAQDHLNQLQQKQAWYEERIRSLQDVIKYRENQELTRRQICHQQPVNLHAVHQTSIQPVENCENSSQASAKPDNHIEQHYNSQLMMKLLSSDSEEMIPKDSGFQNNQNWQTQNYQPESSKISNIQSRKLAANRLQQGSVFPKPESRVSNGDLNSQGRQSVLERQYKELLLSQFEQSQKNQQQLKRKILHLQIKLKYFQALSADNTTLPKNKGSKAGEHLKTDYSIQSYKAPVHKSNHSGQLDTGKKQFPQHQHHKSSLHNYIYMPSTFHKRVES